MKKSNQPKKGDRIAVDPIRKLKDIKAIIKLLSSNSRDQLLFAMGINNGLRTIDLLMRQYEAIRGEIIFVVDQHCKPRSDTIEVIL